jgi:hypothetical protein
LDHVRGVGNTGRPSADALAFAAGDRQAAEAQTDDVGARRCRIAASGPVSEDKEKILETVIA